jgi:hypothetical protein
MSIQPMKSKGNKKQIARELRHFKPTNNLSQCGPARALKKPFVCRVSITLDLGQVGGFGSKLLCSTRRTEVLVFAPKPFHLAQNSNQNGNCAYTERPMGR